MKIKVEFEIDENDMKLFNLIKVRNSSQQNKIFKKFYSEAIHEYINGFLESGGITPMEIACYEYAKSYKNHFPLLLAGTYKSENEFKEWLSKKYSEICKSKAISDKRIRQVTSQVEG